MSSPIALQELFKAGFDDFVIPVYEDAPYTTIQNRAKVTRSLKAIAGVERIHVKGLNLLPNEFGPNGERVFEADNKDARIRFVGGWTNESSVRGSMAATALNTTDYVEITFFGTALNMLILASGSSIQAVASVDGGAEGASLLTSYSTVLSDRNYTANQIVSVVSGLSLDWHTVRFTRNGSDYMYSDTFDIITPIHISESSLKIGSQSLKSVTKYSPEKSVSNAGPDLSKAKAWVFYDMVNQVIFKSTNINAVLRTATDQFRVFFEKSFKDDKYIGLAATSDFAVQVTTRNPDRALVDTRNSAGTLVNANFVGVAFFGELIDE